MTAFRMTVGEIARVVGGRLSDASAAGRPITGVSTDTRKLPPPSFAYLALRGPNFDGNRFAPSAVRSGADVVIVSDPAQVSRLGCPAILVDDGLTALQALAAHWREGFRGALVAITGSNGKTIVKEMLAPILGRSLRTYRSPGSYNSQVGVALSLLRMPLDADVALIECGVSRPGEMARLAAMTRPDHGLVTHLGTAHLAGFGTPERIAREKLRLFEGMAGTLVLHESARPYRQLVAGHRETIWVGRDRRCQVVAEHIEPGPAGYHAHLRFNAPSLLPSRTADGDTVPFELHSYAEHDIDNAACAAALARVLGVEVDELVDGLAAYTPAPMRIEVHTTPTGVTLINDSYSADPASARSALQTLTRLAADRRAVAVLGAMTDLGEASVQRHRELGRRVAEAHVARLIAVGREAEPMAAAALEAGMPPESVLTVADGEACAEELDRLLRPGDVVLVKASRPLQLERTAEHLLESVSPTRLYIDLGVIADNVRQVRAWIGSDVALIAVVKSFGYGSDVVRVSELLERQGVAYLFVAYPDEGALLRRRGIQTPILVNSVLSAEADKIAKYRLSAVVTTVPLARALDRAAAEHGVTVPVHVKVDTGMGRFGVLPHELLPLLEHLGGAPNLRLEGLMSHLACAEEAAQDAFTQAQLARFAESLAEVDRRGLRPPYVHIANSAGLLRFPHAHYTAVRLGLGLYGSLEIDAGPAGAPRLSAAIALHSRVVAVRELPAGSSIGYGRTYETSRPTRLGLVALGYNDGLPWAASGVGRLWIRGQRSPIVGRISMDVTAIDLTDVPDAVVGDDVVIFGDGQRGEPTVPELARWAGTIPYEILCRVSPRVRRIVRLED